MIALDASAVLALLFRETGHARVAEVLGDACVSTVNRAEVLARFSRDGKSAAAVDGRLDLIAVEWVPFDRAQARRTAELVPQTKAEGLSLGDRACLALASLRGARALTADRAWRNLSVDVEIEVIR